MYKRYRPKAKTFQISNELAEKLHHKMMSLISVFKTEDMPPLIFDGEDMTYRCVAGNEIWTLAIHCPLGRALQISDVCRQIINAYSKENEPEYLRLLDEVNL